MADKPEQDAAAAEAAGEGMKTRRKRAGATIDLPPSEMAEIREAAPVTDAPPTAAQEATLHTGMGASAANSTSDNVPEGEIASQPSSGPAPMAETGSAASGRGASPFLAGIVGLVAGAIGGFGAYQFMPAPAVKPAPGPDTALVQRLDAMEKALAARPGATAAPEALAGFEKRLAEAVTRENALRAEIARLASELAGESEARKKAIASLPAAPAPAGAGVDAGEIEALRKALAALTGRVDAAQPREEALKKAIDALSSRFTTLTGREAMGAGLARLAAATLLEEATTRGRPLSPALDMLRSLGVEAARLQPLQPFAEAGIPGAEKLLGEWKAIKPAEKPAEPKAELGLMERLKAGAGALVEVRRAGEVTGSGDAALIARAEQALQRGDLAAALAEAGRLSPARAADYATWRGRAETVVRARDAVLAIRNEALAALAGTGAAK